MVLVDLRTFPVPPVDVEENPGGSGTFAFLGLVIGGELRSMTHCGGDGVVERLLDDMNLDEITACALYRNTKNCTPYYQRNNGRLGEMQQVGHKTGYTKLLKVSEK